MNRREALSAVGVLLGGTVVGSAAFLEGCKSSGQKAAGLPLDPETLALLNQIGETILPTTKTPGAKAANVAAFMNTMVIDCYEERDQKIFLEGIGQLQTACQVKNSASFMDSTPDQRTTLLIELDKEQKSYTALKKKEDPAHYFRMMKELTILGYFHSEIGATQALRYEAVPGRYEGCVPYHPRDKAWATA